MTRPARPMPRVDVLRERATLLRALDEGWAHLHLYWWQGGRQVMQHRWVLVRDRHGDLCGTERCIPLTRGKDGARDG